MVAPLKTDQKHYTAEEYLELERAAEFKSEFWNGQIVAMSGGSREYSTIIVNLTAEVGTQLKGKPCRAFSNDTKVRTGPLTLFVYPDLSVVCGEPRFHDEQGDVLLNPTLVFEVLSPSTEAVDRGKKFEGYRRIASFTDYVLIAQDEPYIEHYSRQSETQWLLTTITGLDASLSLPAIGCTLALAEIYDRVEFAQPSIKPEPE
ncbi:MAG TPA: Uma2 family endonuclease [Chthonomonadaceae bacterium]|nr:Uma2 family endonuclease [Chthonomonadaceae bacterium]